VRKPRYTDPLGAKLPALERNILKHRAMEMLLVMFYTEELKRDVLSRIQTTDRFGSRRSGKPERVPQGTKNPVDKALGALVADKAISAAEKAEIVELIDYRNVVAHQMHYVFANVSPAMIARDIAAFSPELLQYNYDALERLRYFQKLLDGLYRTHHYIEELRYDRILFRAAEKTFLDEIKRLNKTISRLMDQRNVAIKRLNSELSLKGTGFVDELDPRHPYNTYDDNRLTRRGVEICYRLFDAGKSLMAVAHLMGLSLHAARKRHKQWLERGGKRRPKIDFDKLPKRKFYRRDDD
jgi:hypothetical protein